MRIERDDNGLTPTLDFTRFNDLFAVIDDTLAAEPHQSVFDYDEARNRVLAFEVGNPGQLVDRAALEQAMARAVDSADERAVEIPLILLNTGSDFTENPLGIRDLLASGDSLYRGSADYRLHNIAVGAAKLDGLVVPAGETFSFLESIGPFRLSEGWVEGSIIVADKTEQGIGGGICPGFDHALSGRAERRASDRGAVASPVSRALLRDGSRANWDRRDHLQSRPRPKVSQRHRAPDHASRPRG